MTRAFVQGRLAARPASCIRFWASSTSCSECKAKHRSSAEGERNVCGAAEIAHLQRQPERL